MSSPPEGGQAERTSISPSLPSDSELPSPSPSPSPPHHSQGAYKWLQVPDIMFTAWLGGVPRVASWIIGSVTVMSFPPLNGTAGRSTWFLVLDTKDFSPGNSHTIDLSDHAWRVKFEESTYTIVFDLGDVERGNGFRFIVTAGSHESFSYLLSHVAYMRGCISGAFLETQVQPFVATSS